MDADLKGPLEKLAEALHRAIEQSSDVEDALGRIKTEGYQAFLLLEVTVALGQGTSGAELAEIAHALSDEEDADEDADEDDDDASADVDADDEASDDEESDADAEADEAIESAKPEITAIERRIVQLPVRIEPDASASEDADEEPRLVPGDLEFLKSIRIRLD